MGGVTQHQKISLLILLVVEWHAIFKIFLLEVNIEAFMHDVI